MSGSGGMRWCGECEVATPLTVCDCGERTRPAAPLGDHERPWPARHAKQCKDASSVWALLLGSQRYDVGNRKVFDRRAAA